LPERVTAEKSHENKNVTSFGLALALTASAPSQDKAKDARIDRIPQGKPNVVFILADNT